MPAARLQPIPFLDPHRLAAFVEQDLPSLEPGLRLAARHVPLPAAGGGKILDALATDADGRVVGVRIRERLDSEAISEALAARSWIEENLPALRAVCPALAGASDQARILLLSGRVDPSAAALLSRLTGPGLGVLEIAFFEAPSGLAMSVRDVGPPAVAAAEPSLPGRCAESPAADPLSGIPLTAEEAAEFRRLVEAGPARHAAGESVTAPRGAAPPLRSLAAATRRPSVHISGFMEN